MEILLLPGVRREIVHRLFTIRHPKYSVRDSRMEFSAGTGLSPGESLAESVRGTLDRLNPKRMSGSRDRAQSGASATRPHDLQPVLSSESDASWAREGRARSPTSLDKIHWADH